MGISSLSLALQRGQAFRYNLFLFKKKGKGFSLQSLMQTNQNQIKLTLHFQK